MYQVLEFIYIMCLYRVDFLKEYHIHVQQFILIRINYIVDSNFIKCLLFTNCN